MKQAETILTITGSDSTGGSGVQADIKTTSALGGQAVSVITSITMQNSLGIQQFFDLPAQVVEGQLLAIIDDLAPQVVKIGMLRQVDTVLVLAAILRRYRPRHIIYDPIVRSSRGDELMPPQVVQAVREQLLPLCTYVVERRPDASHGQANLFSSALCVYLSRGEQMDEAVSKAREYVSQHPLAGEQTGRAAELYQQFATAVEQYYRHYSDVAFYAEQLGVGSRYLAQVCRRIASRSPKQIIEERLMQELQRELATTRPLKEIAQHYGFSSQAHLTRFFRKQLGISPTAYRKLST